MSRPLAILLSLLLALTGVLVLAPPASAAPGDVSGATLQWGVKASFRNYISGPIAHGSWTVDGVSDATPFGWSDGSGTTNGAPAVAYPGSIRLTGHAGFGVPAGEYALDLTFSDVGVRITGASTAEVILDARSRGFADPTSFVELNDVVFATLDLAGGADASTADSIAYTGVPATLTADGATAFGGFYAAGTALDPVSFSWPVEQAAAVTATTTTLTASPDATAVAGETVTLAATVSPAAVGSVQFLDGSTALGAPVVVTAGTAILEIGSLAAGSHSLSAAFTSSDAAFGSSASVAVPYVITTSGGGGVPEPEPVDGLDVTDATLVWGYSGYAQTGVLGQWRFFGATGDAVVAAAASFGYAPQPGSTSMPPTLRPGTEAMAVQFTNGTGSVDPDSGAALISYDGSFTVNAYAAELNAPDETYSDPIVAVSADGSGTVTFDVSFGEGADFFGGGAPTPAVHLGRVVLATFTATDAGVTGFTITPIYQGRAYDAPAGETAQARECAIWGAWPTTFVDALPKSLRAHYYSTSCTTMQTYKPALPLEVAYTLPEAPVVPTITVSQTEGLATGDVVTVTGTGFAPAEDGGPWGTRPPLAGKFGGVYVTFGSFLDVWQPSAGAPSSARAADRSTTKWIVNPEDLATVGVASGGVAINADGSFEVDVVVTKDFAGALADGNYGIYTYPGSGATYAPFETYTPIAFATDEVEPTVTVSPTEDLEAGDVITVTGSGFVQDETGQPLGTRPPLAGKFGGVYVVFGTFADSWKPSEGVTDSATRKGAPGQTRWFVNAEDVATIGGAARGGAAIGPDGTFSVELTVTDEFEGALADGNFGVYTYAGGGAVHARFETYTPIAFATEPTTPTEPVDPVASPGSLTWGVKASFRSYVTGPIAHGSITTAGGAGSTSGGFWFPQSTGSASGDSAGYRGSVTFTGHGGQLNLRLADPVVRVTGPGTGILSVVASGSRVDFATLALGTPSTDATGARTWTAAPATLTADGAASFAGFYAAGTALDPVTFTIGSVNATSGRGNTLAAAVSSARTPAATPPATTGIVSDASTFTEGGEYTFSADGFLPGESGILAVIYSTPTVLADDLSADAAGTVTWTGTLPRGLTGAHTLTFQGSVSRGIELDIAAAETVGCVVESAELLWGFKESFRAYIDGSIANGEWTAADGATYETPLFTWANGAGGHDRETGDADLAFTGSVRFTGHGGVLDTTIANPRVVFDGDRATLFLDVTGTTQAGETVAATGVEFASLDLAAAEQTGGGDLVAFTGIPATLTAAGAAAFGTYPEGEELDPVELRITVGADCAEPVAAPEEASATGAEVEPVSEVVVWPWILLAVALAAVVAVAVVLVVRARRA